MAYEFHLFSDMRKKQQHFFDLKISFFSSDFKIHENISRAAKSFVDPDTVLPVPKDKSAWCQVKEETSPAVLDGGKAGENPCFTGAVSSIPKQSKADRLQAFGKSVFSLPMCKSDNCFSAFPLNATTWSSELEPQSLILCFDSICHPGQVFYIHVPKLAAWRGWTGQ